MTPNYKLTYFDVTGLAESIRFLLSYGGLEFEDIRITQDNWPTVKPSIKGPLGQVPVLEVDGNILFQSTAIARYLGTTLDITGATPLENCQLDAVADSIVDLRFKVFLCIFEQDETKKKSLADVLIKETLPLYLSKLDAWAEENNGYLALGKLTWVDFLLIGNLEFLDEFSPKLLSTKSFITNYANLEALRNKIYNNPNIKAYLERRPKPNA